jgi:tetratricopeptide (TPR) repeat protein
MRARQGLADVLWGSGRKEEALEHYWELLRLNTNDNQGIRFILLPLLLKLDRNQEALRLLKQYGDEPTAVWMYSRALLTFRDSGATRQAEKELKAALDYNPNVPDYLIARKRIPVQLPDYIGLGDEDEAMAYAADSLSSWRRTSGALEWLKQTVAERKKQIASGKPAPRTRKQPGKGKRRGKG